LPEEKRYVKKGIVKSKGNKISNFNLELNFVITPKNINAIVQIYELDLNEYVFKKSALVNIPTIKKEAIINLNE
tara:strand:+ start:75 stop:296 length:222 start_codon:yes stop_codon:yes gene_type:complete